MRRRKTGPSGNANTPQAKSARQAPPDRPGGSTGRSAQPAHRRRPGRALRFVLLVIFPILVAAAALVVVPKRFAGTLLVDFPALNPQASEVHPRTLLLDYGWRYAQENTAGSDPISWEVLDGPTNAQWTLRLVARSRRDCLARLTAFDAGFRNHVAEITRLERNRLTEKERDIARKLSDLAGLLAAIDAQLADSPASRSPNTPLAELTEAIAETRQQWGHYTELRDRVRTTGDARDALRQAPPIEHAVVDAVARESAYQDHAAMQEDMRHLEIQLFQIKSMMIASAEDGRDSLDDLLAASDDIGKLTDTAAAENASSTERPLLEQTSEKAAEYHHRATLFAQAWTRDLLRLQELAPDARTAEILTIYDDAAKRIRDFQQVSSQAIATLRRRVRTLGEQADPNAATLVAQATLVRRAHDVQAAFRTFDRVATDLIAQDNYLLDAALQSARGLWQRTQATRRDIDRDLEERAVGRAKDDRAARIATMTEQLDTLRGDLVTLIDGIMEQSAAAQRIADRLPAFVDAATAGESARDRRVLLESRVAELDAELDAVRSRMNALVDVDALVVAAPEIADWPDNLKTVIGGGVLAWCLGLLGMLGVLRLTNRNVR